MSGETMNVTDFENAGEVNRYIAELEARLAVPEMTWAERELAAIVEIVQPAEHEDAITNAIIISAIRRLIEADGERYLALVRKVTKMGPHVKE